MEWEWDGVKRANCAVFFKVGEEWGELSNMHNEFPLRVGGVPVGSSEALYQLGQPVGAVDVAPAAG